MLLATHLRGVLRGAGPFAVELAALKAAAGGEGAYAKSLDTLGLYAAKGVPTFDELAVSFDLVVPQVVAKSAIAPLIGPMLGLVDGAALEQNASAAVRPLVPVIRRLGELQPQSLAATLAKAEADMRAGNLGGAVEYLALVDGEPGKILANWLTVARARLAVERAAADLGSAALERLSKR
ncbi:MAG: hypothetical protein OHK0024_35520 [Thalassobaculales bacterium]